MTGETPHPQPKGINMGIQLRSDRRATIRSRVACGVIVTIALILLILTDKGEPARGEHPPPKCAAQDEVLVSLEGDAYDMKDNSLHCIHIDAFR